MYRIFVADDNQLALEALKESVAWESYGCEIVGEADNGSDALREILRLQPDLALLDIRMPKLSGLEVVQAAKEKGFTGVTVIISAYDDFAYAQQGLKIGVFDYLLKPVDDGELIDVIKRAVGTIRENEKTSRALARLEQNKTEVRRKLLLDGINGYGASAKELKAQLRESFKFHGYELLLICPHDSGDFSDGAGELDTDAFIAYERTLLQSCERRMGVNLLDTWKKEGLTVLLSYQTLTTARDYDLTALKIARFLFEQSRRDGWQVDVSVSNLSKELEELPKCFEQTVFCHNSRFFLENCTVVHYGSLESRSIHNEYRLMRKLEELYAAFREEPGQAGDCLEDFLTLLYENGVRDMQYVKNVLIQAAMMLSCIVSEKAAGAPVKSVECMMREMKDIHEIRLAFDWLRAYAGELAVSYQERKELGLSAQTRKLLEYLNLNYAQHLTLQDAADWVGISGSHLCRVLKNDTGETFVSLLNKIRIQAAIRLLKEGRMKVYEIAEAVGFGNYAYFYQLFKKETGYPPTDFH